MTDEQREKIREYVKIISQTVEESDDKLLDFAIDDVADRALLYLNDKALDPRLERIIARVVVGVFNKTKATRNSAEADMAITSISDNGQSISYSGLVKRYLATSGDSEIFDGFTTLLAPYRRVNVASS